MPCKTFPTEEELHARYADETMLSPDELQHRKNHPNEPYYDVYTKKMIFPLQTFDEIEKK